MNREIFMKTDRTVFSLWTEGDEDQARLLWGDPQVTAYICASGRFSGMQILERLELEIGHYRKYRVQYFPVFTPEGELIGCCGLRPHGKADYEFGIHLRPAFWGQGYGKELSEAVFAYAKEKLGAKSLFAGHHPKNVRSEAFLRKMGFCYQGGEYYPPTGLMHPSYLRIL